MNQNDDSYGNNQNYGQGGNRGGDKSKGNVRGGNNYNSNDYSTRHNDSNSVRFPGDLGPDPFKPGGGRKKY